MGGSDNAESKFTMKVNETRPSAARQKKKEFNVGSKQREVPRHGSPFFLSQKTCCDSMVNADRNGDSAYSILNN